MASHTEHHVLQRALALVLALVVAVLAAALAAFLAVASFGLSPWAPALVALALIAGGVLTLRRTGELLARAAALGFVAGALLALLLWPLLVVDTGTVTGTG